MSAVAAPPIRRPLVETQSDSHKWWVLGVVVMGTFMSILDSTVVNIALPKLITVFSTDVHGAQWVLTSYLLALAVVIPMTGYLQETYGGKRVYIITITLFTLASMLCGIAWNLNSMILFRVLQGLGGGLIMPLGMSLLLREFRPEERGTALGIFGIPLMMGPAIGPTLGGYLVQYVDWRFIFYINVPIGIVAVIAASRVLRESASSSRPKLDVLGVLLVASGSALLLLGVDNGPNDGWGSTKVLFEMGLGALLLVAFVFVELNVDQPLLELRLFRSFTFTVAVVVTLIVQVALFGAIFLLPLFLQNLRGLGAMETGMMLIPQALTVAAVMPISGRIYDRFGPRLVLIPGMILLAYSTYRFSGLDLGTSNLTIIGWMMLRGLGMGLGMMPATTTSMNAVPRQLIPRATALTNALQRISGSFGTAIMATVLTTRQSYQFAVASQTVTPLSPGFQLMMAHARTMPVFAHLPVAATQQMGFLMIYGTVRQLAAVRAIDDTFFVAAVICIPAVLCAIVMQNKKAAASPGPRPVLAE
jgi:DHA2 family multidrug resistance protein